MDLVILFQLIVLIFSVIIHEISHGYVAEYLGDSTARLAGRLTLNPIKHLDPFGSVILPLILSLLPGGIVFGWAKPVPYNPFNLKNPEHDGAMIAAAGPLSNFLIAFVFSVIYRIASGFAESNATFISLAYFSNLVVLVNVILGVFNLVPIPPLDGSKVLFLFIGKYPHIQDFLERYGFMILIAFIFFGWHFINPIVFGIYRLFIGL